MTKHLNYLFAFGVLAFSFPASAQESQAKAEVKEVPKSYAWKMIEPLGLRTPAEIDTALYNYYQQAVPSEVSIAYASTGNLGGEGVNMIFLDRKPRSDFFFRDAVSAWLPMQGNHVFYNTRIPMTLMSYNTGGGKESTQDRLKAIFSGNVNSKLQIGANVDYLYSKGSYENQAVKDLIWGFSSSYMGHRFEYQTFYNHYNNLNKENGGITDDLYITDPAVLQGGSSSIQPKSIPTNLTQAHSRVAGDEFLFNGRYKIGFWREDTVQREPNDSVDHRVYVPVTSFIWTLNYTRGRHVFNNTSATEAATFWENNYISNGFTHDVTSYWSLKNTFGIALLEGFNKYAKAGLAAYVTHEIRKFKQTEDTIPLLTDRPDFLSPYPYDHKLAPKATENLLWVGAQLTKQSGRLLRYEATAKIGVVGEAAGEVYANGNVSSRFKLWRDSVSVMAYGHFSNINTPYLMRHYVSNHFIWDNDFGKIRRFKVGGVVTVPFTHTQINVGAENIQNYVYFNEAAMPAQHKGSVQIFSATLEQNFRVGILNWRNKLTYQTSSNQSVIAIPKFAAYSNLYILFKVAKVLKVQLGLDCNYYSKYYAPNYQPATMSFYNQKEIKVGNYPFMNAYVNMKLSKARFYLLFTHVNQGLTGKNYFALPHYPMNPRRFLMGVSVDFAN